MKAPTLVDGDLVHGDLVLWESSAIMAHPCIKAGSDMWPANTPAEQVEVLRWLSWYDNHRSVAVAAFYFEHIVKATFGIGPPDREALKPKVADLLKYATVLNGHLACRTYVACGSRSLTSRWHQWPATGGHRKCR
jgi:glutathione S-transferase